jgi:stage II sporulation protein E
MLPVPDFIKFGAASVKSIDTVILERNAKNAKNQLSSIAASFSQIADIISKSQESEKAPSRQSLHILCLNECANYCYGCPKHFICWKNDIRETEENLNRLSMELFVGGMVGKETVTERFLHRCPNIDLIIDKINDANKKKTEGSIKNNKLEVASCDYRQIANLLLSIGDFKECKTSYGNELNKRLNYQLAKIGLVFEDACIIGNEQGEVVITGINIEMSKCTKEILKNEIESVLSRNVGELEFCKDGIYFTASVSIKPMLNTNDYSHSIAKGGEKENGDSFIIFDGVGGKKYIALCDGMGSGESAKEASSTSVSLLKEILSVSNNIEGALNMLSSLLRAKSLECSSTVDILEIDLSTGKGQVIKCGASPTYIKRGDKVFKLQSQTMPLGILKELDAEESSFELMAGDVCIMVSDGVADSKNDEKITRLISEFSGNIDTLPTKIIEKAKKQLGQNDDMTVIVTEIYAN